MSSGRRNSQFSTPRSSRSVASSSRDLFTPTNRRNSGSLLTPQSLNRMYNMARTAYTTGVQAYRAAQQARSATQASNNRSAQTTAPKKFNKLSGVSTGKYVGKFKSPDKSKKAKTQTYYLSKGFHTTMEKFGTFSDPHCLYVGHSTFYAGQVSRTIMGALLRKLFLRAGIPIGSRGQELPNSGPYDATGFRVIFEVRRNEDNQVTSWVYDITNNSTLTSLIDGFNDMRLYFYYKLIDESPQYYPQVNSAPYALYLYAQDANTEALQYRNLSTMLLQNEKMNIGMKSEMTIQNRTYGAGATGADLDRVDNQPLQGYLYEFSNAAPKLRYSPSSPESENAIDRVSLEGTIFAKASAYPAESGLDEPPVPAKWSNLIKSSRVTLQPGEMKKCSVAIKYIGVFPTLFESLCANRFVVVGGDPTKYVNKVKGRSQILCLEEILRTPSENQVTLAFEQEFTCGVTFKTRKLSPLNTEFQKQDVVP